MELQLCELPNEMIKEVALRSHLADLPNFLKAIQPFYIPNKLFKDEYYTFNHYNNTLISELDFIKYIPNVNYQKVVEEVLNDRINITYTCVKEKCSDYGQYISKFGQCMIGAYMDGHFELLNFMFYHDKSFGTLLFNRINCTTSMHNLSKVIDLFLHPNVRKFGPYYNLGGLKNKFKQDPALLKEYLNKLTDQEKQRNLVFLKPINIQYIDDLNILNNNEEYYVKSYEIIKSFFGVKLRYYNNVNYKSVHEFIMLASPYIITFQEGVDINGYIYTKLSYLFYLALFNNCFNVVHLLSSYKFNGSFVTTILYNNNSLIVRMLKPNNKLLKLSLLSIILRKQFYKLKNEFAPYIPEYNKEKFDTVKHLKDCKLISMALLDL